jgi:hypothetical protein
MHTAKADPESWESPCPTQSIRMTRRVCCSLVVAMMAWKLVDAPPRPWIDGWLALRLVVLDVQALPGGQSQAIHIGARVG